MNKRYLIRGTFVFSICLFLAYFTIGFIGFGNDVNAHKIDCGMSGGPCRGEKIALKHYKAEELIDCPNGKIGITHLSNNKFPIIFKLDNNVAVIWAYRLETEACSDIPMLKMRNLMLDKSNKSIRFFNETHSEPGVIYLTKDFDFDYLCLSMF